MLALWIILALVFVGVIVLAMIDTELASIALTLIASAFIFLLCSILACLPYIIAIVVSVVILKGCGIV